MRVTFVVPLWLACTAAAAQVQWRCTLSADLVRLHCVSAVEPAAGHEETTARRLGTGPSPGDRTEPAAAPAVTAQVGGTRFPLDPRRRWTVELWSPPSEPAFVELLARSTICYRTPNCTVQVDLGALQPKGS